MFVFCAAALFFDTSYTNFSDERNAYISTVTFYSEDGDE
jgi:hypothetical protein